MSTTIQMLREWFDTGLRDGATHMIVKCDSFDWEDYPVYVYEGQSPREVSDKNVERTMEVYAMHLPFNTQAAEFRSFHWESK